MSGLFLLQGRELGGSRIAFFETKRPRLFSALPQIEPSDPGQQSEKVREESSAEAAAPNSFKVKFDHRFFFFPSLYRRPSGANAV